MNGDTHVEAEENDEAAEAAAEEVAAALIELSQASEEHTSPPVAEVAAEVAAVNA
jgi:hypothetical protein